ncbi:MAG: multicopper oxidase domain-containing protein [Thioploca sp.]|nr:multicopper oxidase domain-containing protein [Thioploca sp.]
MNVISRGYLVPLLLGLPFLFVVNPISANVFVQCPGDIDGDAVIDTPDPNHPHAKCMHLSGGDGFITMADGKEMYIFGFADVTGLTPGEAMITALLSANMPSPAIVLNEGDEFYLTLTNVGMVLRPDLFDAHTIHWHGFPQAAPVFDGVPDASLAIKMGASFTYYYKVNDPGTFMYHCHVEATEHMQMGMLGNLYVKPAQNGTPFTYQGKTYTQFAYNDGDGSTGYDVDFAIQMGSFDPEFHDASEAVQPLPFAHMKDTYPMLNGRGYPDTIISTALPAPSKNGGKVSQKQSSLITANQGKRILLRLSNLNVTEFYTLASLGIPMQIVGKDAKLLRGPDGKNLYYQTNSVTLGSGESVDIIFDTQNVTPGQYFLYTTNLNYLSNNTEDFGGMMTEIVIN